MNESPKRGRPKKHYGDDVKINVRIDRDLWDAVNGQNKHKYVRVCPPNPDQRYPEKTAQIAGMDTGGIS